MLFKLFLLALVSFGAGASIDSRYLSNDTRRNTTIQEAPYQVSLQVKSNNDWILWCGGFIISEDYVLTAAHCTQGIKETSFWVQIGTAFTDKGGTMVPVEKIINHPEYFRGDKDIAIIKTKTPMKLSDKVAPVNLPPKWRVVKEKSKMNVTGWGYNQEDGIRLTYLMVNEVSTGNYNSCAARYKEFTVITENMICGGFFDIGKGAIAHGDSGSPAIQNGLAVGIVSFGKGGWGGHPCVYTNIAAPAVRDFITKHTGL